MPVADATALDNDGADEGSALASTATDPPAVSTDPSAVSADPPPVDASANAGPYPAPRPRMPQIPNHGGGVLHDPIIVSVTFPGDPLADRLAAFGEEVGGLDWWAAAVSPYGAARGKSGGHVALPEGPPATMTDADVEAFLARKLDDGSLPAATDQTLYTLYVPASTVVTLENGAAVSCKTFLGYHSAILYRSGNQTISVPYAVINRCGDLDQVTETSSHEIAEAASDPYPITVENLGYMLLASNAWTILGGENADMCAGVSGVTENGWALTRVWNNENAALGQQPCLPAAEGALPYFNAGIADDTISTRPGTTVTTTVHCYSFGPLPGPMSLFVQKYPQDGLEFTTDRSSCSNGDRVTMNITVPASARPGTELRYSLLSKLSEGTTHMWRGMVHVR